MPLYCCGCGSVIWDDSDDPYADPDCPHCLRESIEAELVCDEVL